MTWLTDTYHMLLRPGRGLDRVVDRGRLGGAVLTVLVVGAILGILDAGVLGVPMVAGIVLGALLALASWFIGGTLWFATTGIVGGDGRWQAVLAGLGWATLPLILLPVTATFGRWWGETWSDVLGLGILIWMVILAVRAVCRAAGLNAGHGALSLGLLGLLVLATPLSWALVLLIGLAA